MVNILRFLTTSIEHFILVRVAEPLRGLEGVMLRSVLKIGRNAYCSSLK